MTSSTSARRGRHRRSPARRAAALPECSAALQETAPTPHRARSNASPAAAARRPAPSPARELLGDVACSPADLGGEVREQQRQRALGEALCELVQPRRHRILLAVAREPTQERRVESTPNGEGHAWTLVPASGNRPGRLAITAVNPVGDGGGDDHAERAQAVSARVTSAKGHRVCIRPARNRVAAGVDVDGWPAVSGRWRRPRPRHRGSPSPRPGPYRSRLANAPVRRVRSLLTTLASPGLWPGAATARAGCRSARGGAGTPDRLGAHR